MYTLLLLLLFLLLLMSNFAFLYNLFINIFYILYVYMKYIVNYYN